jgi:hypothetical protein
MLILEVAGKAASIQNRNQQYQDFNANAGTNPGYFLPNPQALHGRRG